MFKRERERRDLHPALVFDRCLAACQHVLAGRTLSEGELSLKTKYEIHSLVGLNCESLNLATPLGELRHEGGLGSLGRVLFWQQLSRGWGRERGTGGEFLC